ncbi:MAG: phage major capsid protein [Thaumarchaeota archaeon]|nr:phage major capsid protein [Nitrososphaerota archaeon]
MPTTANGIADFSAGFEKIIQPFIQENIPSQVKLLKVLKTNDNVQIMNNAFYVSLRSGRSGGVQTLATDKSKLNTGAATLSQGSIPPAYLAGVVDISDVAIKASRTRAQALQSDLEFQANALLKDFSKQVNRQYFSDGNGIVAAVAESGGSVGAGTVAIGYPDNSTTTIDTRSTYYGTVNGINYDVLPWFQYLAPGNIVGFGSAGTGLGTIAGSSGAVTGGTQYGTLVLTGAQVAVAGTAGCPIYILSAEGDQGEITGMRGALSEGTGNYMGLPRSTLTWQPQFMGTTQNQSISIPNMEQLYFRAYQFAQPGDRYVWFMNQSLFTRFGDLLTALRKTVNETELVSGWTGLSFSVGTGKAMVSMDYDCPDGEAILINLDTWTVCEISPMGFLQDPLLRRVDYLTYQKVFTWYTNLACRAPAANGRMVRQTR